MPDGSELSCVDSQSDISELNGLRLPRQEKCASVPNRGQRDVRHRQNSKKIRESHTEEIHVSTRTV
jgi:hypothetical protein